MEKINTRKDFLTRDYQNKQQLILQKLVSLEKLLEEKKQESVDLQYTIQDLTSQVQLSESIQKSKEQALLRSAGRQIMNRFEEGGETMDPQAVAHALSLQKMKKVVHRRQMVDVARAQAEEIDYLRQELDRMRQRTFPSFVK